jgi:type I restriction enzyme M protein
MPIPALMPALAGNRDYIRRHGLLLPPTPYVGNAAQKNDSEPLEEKLPRLVAQLREQQAEAEKLDAAISANLWLLGFPPEGDA